MYIYPNTFSSGPPSPTNTTYAPGVPCNSLASGEWSASTIDVVQDVVFSDQEQLPANCSFVIPASYTCCVIEQPTASNPSAENVQCIGDIPAPDPSVVTGVIGFCNPVVAFVSDVSDGNSCPEVITRTYSVTDDCGNSTNVTQTITIGDITFPVFAAAPLDVTVECIGDVPAMTTLDWTDNCDGSGTVTGTDGALSGGSCGGTITRTWTYTDACGNVATATQTITIDDTTPPAFAAAPSDVTVECIGDVPSMTTLAVSYTHLTLPTILRV